MYTCKSIYGLKQASNQRFIKISYTLVNMSFYKFHRCHKLFIKYINEVIIWVLVYVDDIMIVSNNDDAVVMFMDNLKTFSTSRSWTSKIFLGLEIARSAAVYLCVRGSSFWNCYPQLFFLEANLLEFQWIQVCKFSKDEVFLYVVLLLIGSSLGNSCISILQDHMFRMMWTPYVNFSWSLRYSSTCSS